MGCTSSRVAWECSRGKITRDMVVIATQWASRTRRWTRRCSQTREGGRGDERCRIGHGVKKRTTSGTVEEEQTEGHGGRGSWMSKLTGRSGLISSWPMRNCASSSTTKSAGGGVVLFLATGKPVVVGAWGTLAQRPKSWGG